LDLGYRLGKMHRHSGTLFGQLGKSLEILYSSWESFILSEAEIEMKLISELNGDLQLGIVNADHIQTLLPQLEMLIGSLQSSLLRVSLPHLTHGDAHFKNIIASQNADQTWKVKSFIDTDEALGGDPEIDIAYIENWLYFSDYKNEFFGCKENFQFGYASECKTNLKYEDRRLIYHCLRSLSYLRTVFGFDTQEFLLANPRNMEYVAKHFDILRSLAEGNALEDLNIPALI
ncbi:MAG: hypothetical protein KBD43_16440, partial [Saprospiraceae bacterium]|nr:hypothetical protein [Saprospiraceae bacterium]